MTSNLRVWFEPGKNIVIECTDISGVPSLSGQLTVIIDAAGNISISSDVGGESFELDSSGKFYYACAISMLGGDWLVDLVLRKHCSGAKLVRCDDLTIETFISPQDAYIKSWKVKHSDGMTFSGFVSSSRRETNFIKPCVIAGALEPAGFLIGVEYDEFIVNFR